uniref:SRP-alpha_N domain-containing protein n=1 Tax=Haemonchus placei TaxID=6290 RepID=A0A0N4WMQ2_HAEPC
LAVKSKLGSIVELRKFQEGAERFVDAINAFVKDVLIQERAVSQYKYNDMTIKFMMDNEFELVFVVSFMSFNCLCMLNLL